MTSVREGCMVLFTLGSELAQTVPTLARGLEFAGHFAGLKSLFIENQRVSDLSPLLLKGMESRLVDKS